MKDKLFFSDLANLARIVKVGKPVGAVTLFVHSAWANIICWEKWEKDGFLRSAIPFTPSVLNLFPL